MKSYRVFVDITIAVTIEVEAKSEEEARILANQKLKKDPYHYAHNAANCGAIVDTGIVDIDEIMED